MRSGTTTPAGNRMHETPTSVFLRQVERQAVEIAAVREGISLSAVIRRAVRRDLLPAKREG